MTTDQIPEAVEAVIAITHSVQVSDYSEAQTTSAIQEAILSYHRRKLEECSGDAKELLEKLKNTIPIEPFGSSQRTCNLLDAQCIELLQLHTAKAVEEAFEYCQECNTPLSDCGPQNMDGTPSTDCIVCQLRDSNATLQKQCEELESELEESNRIISVDAKQITKLGNDSAALQKQCESMRSEISRLQEVPRLEHLETMKTNIDWLNSERVRLNAECDDLRTTQSAKDSMKNFRAADVKRIEAERALSQLQKDVRPLLAILGGEFNFCHEDAKALETFLAAHPELKETP